MSSTAPLVETLVHGHVTELRLARPPVNALDPDLYHAITESLGAAVANGARGIVLKAMAPRVLEDCIRAVHAGGLRLSVGGVDLSDRLAQRKRVENELQHILTPREFEIVNLVAARLENQEIAARLSISVAEACRRNPPCSVRSRVLASTWLESRRPVST